MNADEYVKKIVKNIHCDKARKKDIKMQLLSEIEERVSAGEKLSDIISQMGSVNEVADNFNENISAAEKRKYKRRNVIKIVLPIVVIIAALIAFAAWLLPKPLDIESSTIFSKNEVDNSLMEVIDLLDNDNYLKLQKKATAQMKNVLEADSMKKIKAQMCDDFGNRTAIGTIYEQEILQQGKRFAVCQVNVSYENVSITYTITFDENMKLAGLYLK